MENIGHSKICMNAPPDSKPTVLDVMHQNIASRQPEVAKAVHDLAKHVGAVCDVPRYIKSVYKCDASPVKPDNDFWEVAQEYTYQMLAPYLQNSGSTTSVDFNRHTSNGMPIQKMVNPQTGKFFQNKGEFFDSPESGKWVRGIYTPLFGVSAKREFLPLDEVTTDEKVRTFFGGDSAFVMKQKLLFDNMDDRMLKNATNWKRVWSRYGFTRQYGGFDAMGRAHMNALKCRRLLHYMLDVSGWDRKLPVLKEVYKIRGRLFGPMNEQEKLYFEHVLEQILQPHCVMFNGEIFKRKCGNVSGSGKTTSDNTIGHILITFYNLIRLYEAKYGRIPTFDEIVDFTIQSLYGDDDLGTLDYDYFVPEGLSDAEGIEYLRKKFQEYYGEFGLVIKEKAFTAQFDTIEGLEFLGGTFRKNAYGEWIGSPRYSKVCSTLVYQLEKTRDIQQYVSILEACSALIWTDPTNEAECIRSYLKYYAEEILKMNQDTLSSANQRFVTSVVTGNYSGDLIQFGYESIGKYNEPRSIFSTEELKLKFQSRDFFLSDSNDSRDRVGFKSDMRKYNNNKESIVFDCATNYKGILNTEAQRLGYNVPVYHTKRVGGPDHDPVFVSRVEFTHCECTGTGGNKQLAEQAAAFSMWVDYNRRFNQPSTKFSQVRNTRTYDSDDDQAYIERTEDRLDEMLRQSRNRDRRQDHYESRVDPLEHLRPVRKLSKEENFFLQLIQSMKSYSLAEGEERLMHPIQSLLDLSDVTAASRIAEMFKEGSFNPYGNGQTSSGTIIRSSHTLATQYVVTRPTIRLSSGVFVASSTCLMPSPMNIIGTGATEDEAFSSWYEQIDAKFQEWAPESSKRFRHFLNFIKSLPRVDNSDYAFLWDLPIEDLVSTFWDTFKVGSYNPYGNGQPLTKKQWLKMNKVSMGGKTKVQIDAAYARYYKRATKTKVAPKSVVKTVPLPAVVMPKVQQKTLKERRTGYETRVKAVLSGCAKSYVVALRDPFVWLDEHRSKAIGGMGVDLKTNPCVPQIPAIKTRKFYAFSRGSMGVPSVGGCAWIVFSPRRMANNGDGSSDFECPVIYTHNAGTVIYDNVFGAVDQGLAINPGANGANINTEYTIAQLVSDPDGSGVRYRIVGAGIRVKYVGSPLNASGQYHLVEHPDHTSLRNLSLNDISQLDSYFNEAINTKLADPDGGWVTLSYTPVVNEEFEFDIDQVANAITSSEQPWMTHYMGIMITGAPTGDIFQWECVIHYEAIGVQVRGKTKSPADPVGVAAALNTISPDSQKKINTGENAIEAVAREMSNLTGLGTQVLKGFETFAGIF